MRTRKNKARPQTKRTPRTGMDKRRHAAMRNIRKKSFVRGKKK